MRIGAIGTNAFYKEIDSRGNKAFRHVEGRNMEASETEGSLALRAKEMNMLVVEAAMVVSLANLIERYARSSLDNMYQMMLKQEGQRAEDGRAVYGVEQVVKLA